MSRHIVANVDDIPPGKRMLVNVKGREIGIFNVDGEYLAIGNRCPHEGASLCKGRVVGLVESLSLDRTSSAGGANCSVVPGMAGSSICEPANPGANRTAPRCAAMS